MVICQFASVTSACVLYIGSQVLILSITRRTFESTFGSLSALAADHAAWQTWLSQQNELLSRSIALGRKSNDILQAKFDPQSLQLRGCLWLLNEAQVLASLEDRQAGVALTGRLHSVQGMCVVALHTLQAAACWQVMYSQSECSAQTAAAASAALQLVRSVGLLLLSAVHAMLQWSCRHACLYHIQSSLPYVLAYMPCS